MPTKGQQYAGLVQARKACQCCASIGLKNPAHIRGGMFDSPEIGPWTRWNGDLDARLFVVGQDWGDVAGFERQQGLEDSTSGTNKRLRKLLHSVGISVSQASKSSSGSGVFLTNAVLCLKTGGAQAEVNKAWFTNCGPLFLRPQIELVRPRVVVSLGERAYLAIRDSFGLPRVSFQRAVNSHKPICVGQRFCLGSVIKS